MHSGKEQSLYVLVLLEEATKLDNTSDNRSITENVTLDLTAELNTANLAEFYVVCDRNFWPASTH